MRTSSPLCMADLYKVMDLNENSLLALIQHEKLSQFTASEGPMLSSVCEMEGHCVKMSFFSHFM